MHPGVLSSVESPIGLLEFSKPSMKTFIAVPIFIVASGIQHDCHVYLASLKKYTLPDQQLFRIVLCPHYTCECFIYLAIAIGSGTQRAGLEQYRPERHRICRFKSWGDGRLDQKMVRREIWCGKGRRPVAKWCHIFIDHIRSHSTLPHQFWPPTLIPSEHHDM